MLLKSRLYLFIGALSQHSIANGNYECIKKYNETNINFQNVVHSGLIIMPIVQITVIPHFVLYKARK